MFSWKMSSLRAVALVGVSLGLGFVHNYQFSREGIRVNQSPVQAVSGLEASRFIELAEAEAKWNDGVVFIDARNEEFYAMDGHISGALSLPVSDFDAGLARVESELFPEDQELVCYCGGRWCEDGAKLAGALIARGYTGALVYEGGWAEWSEAGLPAE